MSKDLEDMSLEELSEEMVRNNRFQCLCLNLPVVYDSNVELTNTKWDVYKKSCRNYGDFLRNMVADNISIEDIANKLSFDKQALLKILIENNWIQNSEDFLIGAKKLVKYKNFDCTIWENGIIILTERLIPKKGEDIEVREGKIFKGSLEELAANYKKELFQED